MEGETNMLHRRNRLLLVESLEKRVMLAAVAESMLRWNGRDVRVAAGQWLIQLNSIAGSKAQQMQALQARINRAALGEVKIQRQLGADGLFLVSAPVNWDAKQALDRFSRLAGYRFAEPDQVYELTSVFPNDPYFSTQWGLHNTGQSGGVVDADIDAPEAWDITTGGSEVVVGMIDTGISYTHPDLAANIWTNPFEIPGNGIDDEGNGYIDDVRGWDFGDGDNNPMDSHGHGTHTAGTVAAVGNNGVGVSGVSWNSKLMPLKIMDSTGTIYTSYAVSALYYAKWMRDHGVNIRLTSNSWGGGGYSSSLYNAIAATASSGMLFIAAAGNGGTDQIGDNNDNTPFYPASYNLDNIISVANLTRNNVLDISSNYGPVSVDLAAPGTSIISTYPGGSYATMSGTSMAAPHVAGTAALAFSINPGATYQSVRSAILNSTDPVPALSGLVATGGRLNAYKLVAAMGSLPAPDLLAFSDTGISDSDNVTADNTPTFSGTAPAGQVVRLYASGVEVGNAVATGGTWTITSSPLADGVYDMTVTSEPSGGSPSAPSPPLSLTIDTTPPAVVSVSSPAADGAYRSGATIPIAVTFGETVAVTGIPSLTLETGPSDAVANYTGGSGTSVLTFNYTVAAGHNNPDLDYVSTTALALNGGSIRDVAGNNASPVLPPPGSPGSLSANKNIVVDTTAPAIVQVSSPVADGAYSAGSVIPIAVVFAEPVTISGTPQITLETGDTDAVVSYSSGSGTSVLTFNYTVAPGHNSPDLDYVSSAALAVSGTTQMTFSNTASISIPDSGTATPYPSSIVITGLNGAISRVTATLSGLSHTYPSDLDILLVGPGGQSVILMSDAGGGNPVTNQTLTFDDAAAASLPVNSTLISGTWKPTNYNNGDTFPWPAPANAPTGTTLSVFNATSPNGTWSLFVYDDATVDAGSIVSGWSLTITTNVGSITDAAGNVSSLALPAPGSPGSLAASKNIVIDTAAPTLADGYPKFNYLTGPQSVQYRFSEQMLGLSAPNFTLTNLTHSTVVPLAVSYDPITFTATITWPSFNGDSGILTDGNYTLTASSAITDLAGNPLSSNSFNFFFLNGDVDHDGDVDNDDFGVLFSHFGQSAAATFADGDFDYDGDVDNADFGIFFSRFGVSLPAPAPAAAATLQTTSVKVIAPPSATDNRLLQTGKKTLLRRSAARALDLIQQAQTLQPLERAWR